MTDVGMIHKAELTHSATTLHLPAGAKVLSAQMQRGQPCIWYLFDDAHVADKQQRTFEIHGTGQQVVGPQELIHVGTMLDGNYVWHVFERIRS